MGVHPAAGTGSRDGLSYVVLRGLSHPPALGSYLQVTPGRKVPGGYAGVVIGTGARHGLTAVFAVTPYPSASSMRSSVSAMTGAMRSGRTGVQAGLPVAVVDLIPESVRSWLKEALGERECSGGAADFPVKVTDASLTPLSFMMSGPGQSDSGVGRYQLSGTITPTMTLTVALKGEVTCEGRHELGAREFPPVGAFWFGPLPYSVRVSAEITAKVAAEAGAGQGAVDAGVAVSGGVAGQGVDASWDPVPTLSPVFKITKTFSSSLSFSFSDRVSVSTQVLIGHLWGPKFSLSFGPKIETTPAATSSDKNSCSQGELSFPLTWSQSLGFNPGFGFATGPIADQIQKLARKFDADFVKASYAPVIRSLTPGNIPVTNLSTEENHVWWLKKAFTTPNLVEYTSKLASQELWSRGKCEAVEIDPPKGSGGLQSIACAAAGKCVAIGTYSCAVCSNGDSQVAAEEDDTWPAVATMIPDPADPHCGQNPCATDLVSVACPSSTCVAVGWFPGETGSVLSGKEGQVSSGTGTGWSAPANIAPPGNACQLNGCGWPLLAVSCAPGGTCTAVGNYLYYSGGRCPGPCSEAGSYAVSGDGASLGGATQIKGPAGGQAGLDAISCPSSGSCTAAGSASFATGGCASECPIVATETDGSWSSARLLTRLPANAAANPYANFQAISCPAAGNCVAVGDYTAKDGAIDGMTAIETKGIWAPDRQLTALPAGSVADPTSSSFGTEPTGVSCPETGACTAVGQYDSESGDEPVGMAIEVAG